MSNTKLVDNWRLWSSRLDLGGKTIQLIDECARRAYYGEPIPGDVKETVAAAIQRAQSEHDVPEPVETTGADPVALELLSWMDDRLRRAARSVSRKWEQVISEDELYSEMWLHLVETPASVVKIHDMRPGQRDGVLTNIGHQIASRARDTYEHFSGQYSYSVDEVRKLLERGALAGHVASFEAPTADVLRAAEGLNARYHAAIVSRYIDGLVPASSSAAEKALERAVDSLTNQMNRNRNTDIYEYENGGGRRATMSNFKARSAINLDYLGENEEEDAE